MQGNLSPFDGEIRTRKGKLKAEGSGSLSAFQIVKMDWLNENVVGRIPSVDEFKDDARAFLEALGVEVEEPEETDGNDAADSREAEGRSKNNEGSDYRG